MATALQERGSRAPSAPKFAWSYSRLKNYETCPKRHWHLDLAKDVPHEESDEITWGHRVHEALRKRLAFGTPLPFGMEKFEPWCTKILGAAVTLRGMLLVEEKLALTEKLQPCGYFDRGTWYRGVADVLTLAPAKEPKVALAVDWKTGKILEDSVQLALMAACVFAKFPSVERVRTEFIWLKDGCTTRQDFSRRDVMAMWKSLWPRIEALKQAFAATSYPPKPGFLCRRWCPVEACPYHGT